MKKPPFTATIFLLIAIASAIAGNALKPTIFLADSLPTIELKTSIPQQFGPWKQVDAGTLSVVNPQQVALIDKLYSQVLERVYANENGYRIMLTIAYGRDQRDGMEAHRPEICYPAQGFQISHQQNVTLELGERAILGKQLVAKLQQRNEPITYWHMIGESNIRGGIDKKIKEIEYAAKDTIADGMLLRVSSINNNNDQAFAIHKDFLQHLSTAINSGMKNRFIGIEK